MYCVTTRRKQWKHVCLEEMCLFLPPTGAGKSLALELAPYAFDLWRSSEYNSIRRLGGGSACFP